MTTAPIRDQRYWWKPRYPVYGQEQDTRKELKRLLDQEEGQRARLKEAFEFFKKKPR